MDTNEVNKKLGARLRLEREKLGLNQTAMADAVGVSRATQVNYESGKRLPDTPYLQASGKLGVDVLYVLTGLPTTTDSIERRALLKVLHAICHRLGINYISALDSAYEEALIDAGRPNEFKDVSIPNLLEEVETAVLDAVNKIELNSGLLADVVGTIEDIEDAGEYELRPVTKADLVVMLYRAFRPTGKVDFAVVEQAIKLAA